MMKFWSCSCFVLACVVGLGAQSAQTPPSTPVSPATSATPTTPLASSTPPRRRMSPQEHLAEAQRLLESVSDASIPQDGDKFFDQVKKDLVALTAKYKEAPSKIFDLSPTYSTTSSGWLADLHDLERNVAILIGSSNGLPPALTDAKGKPSKVAVAEPAALAALQEFRTQVELFYDAATTISFGPASTAPLP